MDASSNSDPGSDADSVESQGHNPNYRVMVLRMWREDQGAAWRLTVQEVGQDSRHSFPDLDSLMAHLVRVMAEPPAVQ